MSHSNPIDLKTVAAVIASWKIPPSRSNGTEGESRDREKERIAQMNQRFPGIRFSLHPANSLSVKQYRKSCPWIGLPMAIYQAEKPDQTHVERVLAAYRRVKDDVTHYASYTAIAVISGMEFKELFQAIAWLKGNPCTQVTMTINRMGDNTYVRIKP